MSDEIIQDDAPVAEPQPEIKVQTPCFAIQFGADGHAISALEYSDTPETFPVGQVQCTAEQHANHHAYQLVNGVIELHAQAQLLAKAKARKLAEIGDSCQAAFTALPQAAKNLQDWQHMASEVLARRQSLAGAVASVMDESDQGIAQVEAIAW